MNRLIDSVKKQALMEWSRGNPILAVILGSFVVLLIIVGALFVARAEDLANQALDKSVSPMTEAFVDVWNWGLTPIFFALALYVFAVIAIGHISARLNRPTVVDGDTDSLEMQRLRDHLIGVERQAAQRKEPAGWMNTMMNIDRENLGSRRKVSVTSWLALGTHLGDKEPYLIFRLHILNRTLLRVDIGDGPINGKIMWGDNELRSQRKLKDELPVRLERGEENDVELQQDVLPDTAKAILADHETGKEVEFRFLGVHIPLRAYAPDETLIQQSDLDLPFEYIVATND